MTTIIPEYVKGEIYKITCIPNQKIYIGQTRTHYKVGDCYKRKGYLNRWKTHVKDAKANIKNGCTKLIRAINYYGQESFMIELLETCDLRELDDREIHYIRLYDSYKNGLNCNDGGQLSGNIGSEQRENIGKTLREFYSNPENIKNHNKISRKYYDDERIKKFSSYKDIIHDVKIHDTSSEFRIVLLTSGKKMETFFRPASNEQDRIQLLLRVIEFLNTTINPDINILYKNKYYTISEFKKLRDSQIAGNS